MPVPRVVERLLLAKSLLDRVRFLPVAEPDRDTLAVHILASHDAAELAAAAIADHLDKLPKKPAYLMDYIGAIGDLRGRPFFSDLNEVRRHLKHHGLYPDAKQWSRVAANTYGYLSELCEQHLGVPLDSLDQSELLTDPAVKMHFEAAKNVAARGDYKVALEHLGVALHTLFRNCALRDMAVGIASAEQAIRLAGFGVHGNDLLALQEFLPHVYTDTKGELVIKWEQGKHGHPGNWHASGVSFCLKAFLDLALKVQNARWNPGAVDFNLIYEHRMTALKDGVEVWTEERSWTESEPRRVVIKVLNEGESLVGQVYPERRRLEEIVGIEKPTDERVAIWSNDSGGFFRGYALRKDVRIVCVPRKHELVERYFPGLPEVEWDPEGSER